MDWPKLNVVGSVTQLAATALTALGAEGGETAAMTDWAADRPLDRLILMVVDGLGWDQLERAWADGLTPNLARLKEEARARWQPLATVFPCMTPVALSSILTGAAPARHGIVAQAMRTPEGMVDVLKGPWPPCGPLRLAAPDLAARCRSAGLEYAVMMEHRLRTSTLTELLHGTSPQLRTFMAASGLPVVLASTLESMRRGLVYVYWSAVDTINHERGTYGPEWRAELATLDGWLGRWTSRVRPATRLWVTADHGHVRAGRRLPYGELRRRLAWLPAEPTHCGTGIGVDVPPIREEPLRAAVEELYGSDVSVNPVAALERAGFWGTGDGEAPWGWRVGTHLLWPETEGAYWAVTPEDRPYHSLHGGLSAAEMEVPWIDVDGG